MSNSPDKNTDGAVRVSIFSEGDLIKTAMFGLISVYVFKGVNKIGKATLVFSAGNMSKDDVPESEDETFAPGKKIRVEAGYAEDENPVFEGFVVNHSFIVEEGNEAQLQIECRDFAFPTTMARKNALFENKKDSDAIKEILGKYSPLSVSIDTTKATFNELVQYYATDWDFVLSRADANGLVVVTEAKKISVKKPDVDASPQLKVTYGVDIIEFKGELSAADQQGDVDAWAWSPKEQKIAKVSGKKPTLNKQGASNPDKLAEAVGVDKYGLQTGIADEQVLQSWADGQRLKAGLSRIQGYCKFQGSAKALHGGTLHIDGMGKRFNGTAYIGYVEHDIEDGNWITTVGFGLPFVNITENPDVGAPPASGLLPGIEGVHSGKVTKLDGDPSGENKIQVEIPILNGSNNKIWARLSNFWSSNAYGAFFIPDVGDEVVLGFFNNDPCQAVILGSLYSSKQKPPYEIAKGNKTRAILTKSKIRMEFDEEKKILTLETPGKNVIVVSDDAKGILLKDQNGNKIEMNSSGIIIESAKDLTLKGKMNVMIDAGTNLNGKAKANITLKGMKIEASADTELTVKGTAKAEISAAGQTVVKGAMVMIN
ncbi:MAG: type VI secretion system tip protein VgrG [Dysgonamonadaceae bacterium]|jgi:Rhs element Vgr protein|nr:type VI secretion system tip protein VgrG [Dysgonamonadaceae bacterium]